jgi:1,4-dihydroxy-6-naphthoate synthase
MSKCPKSPFPGTVQGSVTRLAFWTMLTLGISTCPNDTFAFHGILSGVIPLSDLGVELKLLDIQALNEGLTNGSLDVAKGSFLAACQLAETHVVLPVGSALGFGVGPIVVGRKGARVDWENSRVMCPGANTTASLLFRIFHPEAPCIKQGLFSEIAASVLRDDVDYGVLIHEGRFTYQELGLELAEDLGARWHDKTQLPLPLGGLFASKRLGKTVVAELTRRVRQSLEYAEENRSEALASMQRYAQEMSAEVIWGHVDLYVNEHTHALGSLGEQAIDELFLRARESGLLRHSSRIGLDYLS